MKLGCADASIEEIEGLAGELEHAGCFIERVNGVSWLHVNWMADSGVEFVKY